MLKEESISIWTCNKCGSTAIVNYEDINNNGTPFCPDCKDHMDFSREKCVEGKYDATLIGWHRNEDHLTGFVYKDGKSRFPDGLLIHTSKIPNLEHMVLDSRMIIETLNSKYLLL